MNIEEILNKVWDCNELVLLASRPLTIQEEHELLSATNTYNVKLECQSLLIRFCSVSSIANWRYSIKAPVSITDSMLMEWNAELYGHIRVTGARRYYPSVRYSSSSLKYDPQYEVPDTLKLTQLIKTSRDILTKYLTNPINP